MMRSQCDTLVEQVVGEPTCNTRPSLIPLVLPVTPYAHWFYQFLHNPTCATVPSLRRLVLPTPLFTLSRWSNYQPPSPDKNK
eukprot:scaffold4355_cov67-Isochrysis_galbana.AAC.1